MPADITELVKTAAPAPSRGLDEQATLRRARQLRRRRHARVSLAAVALVAAAGVAAVLATRPVAQVELVQRPGPQVTLGDHEPPPQDRVSDPTVADSPLPGPFLPDVAPVSGAAENRFERPPVGEIQLRRLEDHTLVWVIAHSEREGDVSVLAIDVPKIADTAVSGLREQVLWHPASRLFLPVSQTAPAGAYDERGVPVSGVTRPSMDRYAVTEDDGWLTVGRRVSGELVEGADLSSYVDPWMPIMYLPTLAAADILGRGARPVSSLTPEDAGRQVVLGGFPAATPTGRAIAVAAPGSGWELCDSNSTFATPGPVECMDERLEVEPLGPAPAVEGHLWVITGPFLATIAEDGETITHLVVAGWGLPMARPSP